METMKKIMVCKNGQSEFKEWGVETLSSFNRNYSDWISRYFERCEQQECQSWGDVDDVLNTVGASAVASTFELKDL